MSRGGSGQSAEFGLFGPYCRREYALSDEQGIHAHTSLGHHYCLRSKYDSPGMRRLLLDIERVMAGSGFKTLKTDNTTTVGITSRDGRKLIVKRYNTKNQWHVIRRSIRRSRAQNCFEFAVQLLEMNVATAPPVAYIESRVGPLKGRSWLVTEFVEGPVCLDYINDQASSREAGEIAARLERLFQKLAKANITHGDMKATNYILQNARDPVLLDLDGMTLHSKPGRYLQAHQKDQARFMKNWQSRPDIRACFSRVNW